MSKKNNKPPVDRAVATIKRPKTKDSDKVDVTRAVAQGMKKSALWNGAANLQNAVVTWMSDADALEANTKIVTDLRATLDAAEVKQGTLRRDWATSTAHVLTTATLLCGGSVDKVKSLTLDIETHEKRGALEVPAGLTVNPGKAIGDLKGAWPRETAPNGVMLQHASDPANPATFSVPIVWTKSKFTLGGMPSNASHSMRIAAVDPSSPTGQTAWSAWVVGNAK